MNRALLLFGLILLLGCQEELSIAEFEDEFRDYESELRIEALLDPVNPWNSIVRVDRTILITDTTIFNGRDDDGDWDPLTDDVGEDGFKGGSNGFGPPPDEGEGDGQPTPGEPHIDEYDEVLPQLHDTTATITLVELETGDPVIHFAWEAVADSFRVLTTQVQGFATAEELEWEYVTYGGYRPIAVYDSINYEQEYEFQIISGERLITGPVKPLHPPTFLIDDPGDSLDVDTLRIELNDFSRFRWTMESDATVFWVVVELVLGPDSLQLVASHPAGPTDQAEDGDWIGEDILSLYFPGLYRWTVTVPNRAYGAYFYSSLPMRDKQLSNLRDDDGKVVLGIAGSSAAREQYVRILENPDSP